MAPSSRPELTWSDVIYTAAIVTSFIWNIQEAPSESKSVGTGGTLNHRWPRRLGHRDDLSRSEGIVSGNFPIRLNSPTCGGCARYRKRDDLHLILDRNDNIRSRSREPFVQAQMTYCRRAGFNLVVTQRYQHRQGLSGDDAFSPILSSLLSYFLEKHIFSD